MRNPNLQPPAISNQSIVPILNRVSAGLLLILLLAVAGCVTTEDARVDTGTDTAWLVATAPVWVHAIDGKKISNGLAGEKHFAISPGPHTIMVNYVDVETQEVGSNPFPSVVTPSHPYGQAPGGYGELVMRTASESVVPVSFVAEAGHTYYVKDGMQGGPSWHPHVSEDRDPVFQDVKATSSSAPWPPLSGGGR